MKKALFVLPLVMSMLISAFIIYLIFGNGGKHRGHVFYLIPVSDFLASVYVKKYDYGEIFMMIPPVTEIIICIIYNNFDLGFDFGMIISGILLLLNIIGLLLCHCVRYLASKCKSKLSSKLLPKWIAVFFATILISSVFALSLIAWFGNPIKSVIYKNALDEWIEINLDNNRFSVGEYKYDWYDGDFVYEIIDSQTGRQEYLKYKERKNRYDAIYSTWDEKVYVLPKK